MAGFGISSILLPVALLFYDYKTALALVSIFHISGNVGRITFFRKGLNQRLLLLFGIPSVLFTFIGASLVNSVSQPVLRLLLGIFLAAYVLLSLTHPGLKLSRNLKNSVMEGCVYGFFAGLIGTGGPIRGAFLSAFRLEKASFISTSGIISFIVDLIRVPIYLLSGFLQPSFYWYPPFR